MKNIPTAIKKLRLARAFRGYNPGVLDCIETSLDDKIMVVDDDKCTHISKQKEDTCRSCLCTNPFKNEIIVLAIDKKLIKKRRGGMADGAVFDENKFAFVEFKTNAQGNTEEAIKHTYEKATEQLTAALNLFVEKCNKVAVNFTSDTNVICHVIMSEKFPRASAWEQSTMIAFAISNNGIELSFDSEISF